MTLHRTELIMQRRQTNAFIQADPVSLVLNKKTAVSDGMGGRTRVDVARLPQVCRVIPARTRSTSLTYTLPTGEIVSSRDDLLVGYWDMAVDLNDWFMFNGRGYQVTFFEPERQIQTLCELELLGEDFLSTN